MHPKAKRALTSLDDARTEIHDLLEAGVGNAADLRFVLDGINKLIITMPHVQVPDA
jgi:hypothetical protein